MTNKHVSAVFMTAGVLFCVCLILANLLETKLIQLGPIQSTAGIIIFPITYIINDCISEVWGFSKARFIIWLGFVMNFFVVGMGKVAVMLPAAPYFEHDASFGYVFGSIPRIAFASFVAFLAGSFLNAYVMSKMKVASGGKRFEARAVLSTLVGETADSIIFFPIAFAGIVPTKELLILIATQAAMKTAYEIIALPMTRRVVKKVKQWDNSDAFDKNISYNIFKMEL